MGKRGFSLFLSNVPPCRRAEEKDELLLPHCDPYVRIESNLFAQALIIDDNDINGLRGSVVFTLRLWSHFFDCAPTPAGQTRKKPEDTLFVTSWAEQKHNRTRIKSQICAGIYFLYLIDKLHMLHKTCGVSTTVLCTVLAAKTNRFHSWFSWQ